MDKVKKWMEGEATLNEVQRKDRDSLASNKMIEEEDNNDDDDDDDDDRPLLVRKKKRQCEEDVDEQCGVQVLKLGRRGAMTLLQATREAGIIAPAKTKKRKREEDRSKRRRKKRRHRERTLSLTSDEDKEDEDQEEKEVVPKRKPGRPRKVPPTAEQTAEATQIPEKLASLVPPGFEMVRQINERGREEYRVKKKDEETPCNKAGGGDDGQLGHLRRNSNTSCSGTTRVVELGSGGGSGGGGQAALSSPSALAEDSMSVGVKTILVGEGGGPEKSDDGAPPPVASLDPAGVPPVASTSSQFVRLTYKPSQEELAQTCGAQALSGEERDDRDGEVVAEKGPSPPTAAEVTSTTTDGSKLSVTRPEDQMQEVTTTTLEASGGSCFAPAQQEQQQQQRLNEQQDNEYSLDPMSGLLVDKHGTPLQVSSGTAKGACGLLVEGNDELHTGKECVTLCVILLKR